MHRFITEVDASLGDLIRLDEGDARHCVRVLRLQPGAQVEVLADGHRYLAELTDITDGVTVHLIEALPDTEARLQLTLYQGLPKGDKMELICQKAVELGAAEVVPVLMKRSVSRPSAADGAKKRERWQKIAREACKQSGRSRMMAVSEPISLEACLNRLRQHDAVAVPWEEANGFGLRQFAKAHPDLTSLGLVIGPEGGIDADEVAQLREAGAEVVTLGPRILRTETAGLAAMAALMCLYGDMD